MLIWACNTHTHTHNTCFIQLHRYITELFYTKKFAKSMNKHNCTAHQTQHRRDITQLLCIATNIISQFVNDIKSIEVGCDKTSEFWLNKQSTGNNVPPSKTNSYSPQCTPFPPYCGIFTLYN